MRLLSDINFDGRVLHGLLSQSTGLDLIRAQDVGLDGVDDDLVLVWAAENDRMILTHDRKTMVTPARDGFLAGLPMPGLIAVARTTTLRLAIEDILIAVQCGVPDEWPFHICDIPLR